MEALIQEYRSALSARMHNRASAPLSDADFPQ